ncbi:hypothetical protein Hanom_Chr12g01158041 [Helianthus anomalus]
MQGDKISNDPSACRDILSGLGTPFKVLRARGLPRENRINHISSMLVGSPIIANAIMEDYKVLGRKEEENIRLRAEAEALVKAAREGVEQLEKGKAAFEKLKQTESWAATAGLKQAANAALMKEKDAAEADAKEAKEAEARGAKALEEADADRSMLNKTVEDLKVEVHNRVTILEEVTARAPEAKPQSNETAEARDSLTISLISLRQIVTGCVITIVGNVLDAPENATAVNELKERAREAGFKADYNECLSHVNPFYESKFTDERSGFYA